MNNLMRRITLSRYPLFFLVALFILHTNVRSANASGIRLDIRDIIQKSDLIILGNIENTTSVLAHDGSIYSNVVVTDVSEISSSGAKSIPNLILRQPGGVVEIKNEGKRYLRGTDIPGIIRLPDGERALLFLSKLAYGYDLISQSQGAILISENAEITDAKGIKITGIVNLLQPDLNPFYVFKKDHKKRPDFRKRKTVLLESSGTVPDTPRSASFIGTTIESIKLDDLDSLLTFVVNTLSTPQETVK